MTLIYLTAFTAFDEEPVGHTYLKELQKITDQTKSRKRIQFTLEISSGDSFDVVRVTAPGPVG